MSSRVIVLLLASVFGLTGLQVPLSSASSASPVAAAQRPPKVIELVRARTLFSPNGDGRKDELPVRFRLRQPARVSIQVKVPWQDASEPVRRVRLGLLPAGLHTWRWAGREDDGTRAPDGSYRVVLRAAGRTRSSHTSQSAGLDRGARLRAETLELSRRTVYPQTAEFTDRIYFHSSAGPYAPDVEISDQDGQVVRRFRIFGWASWAGTDDSGARLPPGDYRAEITMKDSYGNLRTLTRTLSVSDEALVPRVWSTTVRFADAQLREPGTSCDDDGCDVYCPPTPSERFGGGLTVALPAGCDYNVVIPGFKPPFTLDPSSSWRVSVTGGPTTPGDPDTGVVRMRVGNDVPATTTEPGDATTTTPWGPVPSYEWGNPQGVAFTFAVEDPGASYDVAAYTLEIRRYLPPSG